MGFTLKAAWLAALIAATYPLAAAAQIALEAFFGDSLLLEEWLHGSRRTAAFALVDGWVASIPWVLGFWAIVLLLRATAGAQQRVELWALLLVGAGLLALRLWLPIQVPLLLVLLLIVAAALERCRVRLAAA
ncbi:MAG TPA: hypothetical protein VNA66_03450 [Gammaproteobacteria bacterium]|nr:hypothetical protein [Gammaproteobacteria bacterium]